MDRKTFTAAAPVEHQARFAEALDAVPQEHQGGVISILDGLVAKFKARGLTIPWTGLLALIPLIAACFVNPLTGLGPLILAVAALFAPVA